GVAHVGGLRGLDPEFPRHDSHILRQIAQASSRSTSCTVFDFRASARSAAILATSGTMVSAILCTASSTASAETRRYVFRPAPTTEFSRRISATFTVALRLIRVPPSP